MRIDLRGGFDRDAAEIWIDGDLRWREEAVTTKFTRDLAASIPFEVPDGLLDVRLVLPRRGIEQSLEARATGETCVVARLEDGRLVLEQLAEEPFPV